MNTNNPFIMTYRIFYYFTFWDTSECELEELDRGLSLNEAEEKHREYVVHFLENTIMPHYSKNGAPYFSEKEIEEAYMIIPENRVEDLLRNFY